MESLFVRLSFFLSKPPLIYTQLTYTKYIVLGVPSLQDLRVSQLDPLIFELFCTEKINSYINITVLRFTSDLIKTYFTKYFLIRLSSDTLDYLLDCIPRTTTGDNSDKGIFSQTKRIKEKFKTYELTLCVRISVKFE